MIKHTAGPWLKAETRTEGFVIISRNELIVHSVDEYGHYGPIKNSANANLIAAAPDLLEALEGIINAIDCDDLVARDESIGSDSGDHVYSVVKTARAAIARAKGESQ